jgi:hypothetical protein
MVSESSKEFKDFAKKIENKLLGMGKTSKQAKAMSKNAAKMKFGLLKRKKKAAKKKFVKKSGLTISNVKVGDRKRFERLFGKEVLKRLDDQEKAIKLILSKL